MNTGCHPQQVIPEDTSNLTGPHCGLLAPSCHAEASSPSQEPAWREISHNAQSFGQPLLSSGATGAA